MQGTCLAFVRDMLFVIPLSLSELFVREAAALPSLVNSTETKHMDLFVLFLMKDFYRLLETLTYKNTSVVIVASSSTF